MFMQVATLHVLLGAQSYKARWVTSVVQLEGD